MGTHNVGISLIIWGFKTLIFHGFLWSKGFSDFCFLAEKNTEFPGTFMISSSFLDIFEMTRCFSNVL